MEIIKTYPARNSEIEENIYSRIMAGETVKQRELFALDAGRIELIGEDWEMDVQ